VGFGVHLTPFAPALTTAVRIVESTRRGDEAVTVLYNLDMGGPVDGTAALEEAERARALGIRINVIAIGTGFNPTIAPGQLADVGLLEEIAEMTGGRFDHDPDAAGADLEEIMVAIANALPLRLTQ
jgi:hypothetical protein